MYLRYVCLFLLLSAFAPAADRPGVAGEWQGAIAGRYHITVTLTPADGAELHGSLVSIDQGNITMPMDRASFDGATLRWEIASSGIVYEGKLAADGSEVAGTWKQSGNALALTLRRPGAKPKLALQPATIGRISFKPCLAEDGSTEALCGSYAVFENREKRAGRTISLHIVVLPATIAKPAAEPLFPFAGGPGESATGAFPASSMLPLIRKQRTVVLVDQRGAGQSNLLQCATRDLDSVQSLIGDTIDLDRLKACRDELSQRADLTQYTTTNFVDDIDEVREAMGFAKIDLYGGSYGGSSAMAYLRRHPEHVRTLAVTAPKPPQYKIPVTFARTIQGSMEWLLADCSADPACRAKYPKLSDEFQEILQRLAQSPVKMEVPLGDKTQTLTLSRAMFISNLRLMLYLPEAVAALPALLNAAHSGQWSSFAKVAYTLRRQLEPQLARGLSYSVLCAEDVPATTEEDVRAYTAGTWLGGELMTAYRQACRIWPKGTAPSNFFDPVRSDVPALLIAGENDPATPASAAREAAQSLTHARVVAVPGGTHLTHHACIDNLIAEFYAQGNADHLDAGCAAKIPRPTFQ